MKTAKNIIVILIISITTFSCQKWNETISVDQQMISPVAGLSDEELNSFHRGQELFKHPFSALEGLGPVFISNNCENCHFNGGKGHPFNEIIRYGKWNDQGEFDNMLQQSGPQLQYRAIDGYPAEQVPEDAQATVRLNPPALAGLGYLENIPEATLLEWADPNDDDNDGISGRVAFVHEPEYVSRTDIFENPIKNNNNQRIARFGKKAFSINLFQQTVRALLEDIGITTNAEINDPFNYQADPAIIFKGDGVENPELNDNQVNDIVSFLRSSEKPPRRNEDHFDVQKGEQLFKSIGCNKCHKDQITTGISELSYLNEHIINPFTDLLLHDMGSLLDDGYTEGDAETYEWRTPPLWGLGLTELSQGGNSFYLHDGRATSLMEAINYHGGEAESVKAAFNELSDYEQSTIILFLKSL